MVRVRLDSKASRNNMNRSDYSIESRLKGPRVEARHQWKAVVEIQARNNEAQQDTSNGSSEEWASRSQGERLQEGGLSDVK
jgi:hypothetical protein